MISRRRKLVFVAAIIACIHLTASFVTVAKMSALSGEIISGLMQEPDEALKSSEEVHDWVANKTIESSGYWLPATRILNGYPIGWIMTSITEPIGRDLINQAISEQSLTVEEVTVRVWAIGTAQMLLNSVSFSLCIIGGWVFIRKVVVRTRGHWGARLAV